MWPILGSQIGNVGLFSASRFAGVYDVVVHSHSAVSGGFNNVAVVRVTLQ